MKIGIIGAGHIGTTLAKLFAAAGHDIAISNSRGPGTLADLVEELGPRVQAMTVQDAVSFGDVVVEAIPFGRYQALPVEQLAGKILISASNYYPDRDGAIEFKGCAQTELIAQLLPDTSVVKAFNTIWYRHLADQGDTAKSVDERRVIFLAGDDNEAKAVVSNLIDEIGFGPLDTGSLHGSAVQEPGTAIYNVDMTVSEARAVLG
jgi:predicted dinucleotide-binding enzyme